jgi:peptidoglycan hydrolase-like protein with peptidoglycan-binding domain
MRNFVLILLCTALGLSFGLVSASAAAATKKKHHHVVHHAHGVKHKTHKASSEHIRTAQAALNDLGYDAGAADGIIGRKTTAAVRSFQKDHDLKVDGIIGPKTYALLMDLTASAKPVSEVTAPPAVPPPDFFATHPDFYGYYSADYANPVMLNTPQPLSSRYGDLQIAEDGTGYAREYSVTLEGQPVLSAANQPAPILVSKTYAVGDTDVIIFTTYTSNPNCAYTHNILSLHNGTHNVLPLESCLRTPEAQMMGDSLMISFPENNDGAPTGATWRYQNGTLERL